MTPTAALEAITASYQFWVANDGIEIALVKRNYGALTDSSVRNIGRQYSVTRTLPKKAAVEVAKAINDLNTGVKSAALVETAEECANTAIMISTLLPEDPKRKKKATVPYSAVSKLLWFVRPSGWTMYDSYASRGLGAQGSGKGHFIDFYTRLADANFPATVEKLREQLRRNELPMLLAERIIDYELMRRGGRTPSHPPTQWVPATLQTLGPDIAKRLRRLADGCATTLDGFATESS